MGWLSPKYPKSDTAGATGSPAPRESRAARRSREQEEQRRAGMEQRHQQAIRASKERTARFWEDYERHHGLGSVDWSSYRG